LGDVNIYAYSLALDLEGRRFGIEVEAGYPDREIGMHAG
jgi:hypothetical protein